MKRKEFTVVSSVVACIVVLAGSPAGAQQVTHDTTPRVLTDTSRAGSHGLRSALIWPAATIGAAAGFYAGAVLGLRYGSRPDGAEDPDDGTILLFGSAGSALGGAIAAFAVDHHMGVGTALMCGVFGVAGGYAGAIAAHKLIGEGGGPVWVGYAVSAGLVNSLAAAAARNKHHH
jgi:hypothetical protein